MSRADRWRNVWDARDAARRRLPRAFFEFLDRGTEDETVMASNRAALDATRLCPGILTDVRTVDTGADIFGRRAAFPAAIAPTGSAGLLAFRGELMVARAAGRAGIPYTLATSSTSTIEDIAAAATAGFWLQLYVWEDREASLAVARRAADAGAEALLVTVDTPVMANREYNDRNGFASPIRPHPRLAFDILSHPRWSLDVLGAYWRTGGMPRFVNYPPEASGPVTAARPRRANAADVTWDDVALFRDRWPGRLVLKGLLRPEDAARAVTLGVDGVVVSNHGGRMFDPAPASLDALPGIVDAIGGSATVLFDGGIRRGSDILRARALGADAVLLGRAPLYGVAAAGEAGVDRVLALLREETERCLSLLGRTTAAAVDRTCLWPSGTGST